MWIIELVISFGGYKFFFINKNLMFIKYEIANSLKSEGFKFEGFVCMYW
jgi:hypothetical protein